MHEDERTVRVASIKCIFLNDSEQKMEKSRVRYTCRLPQCRIRTRIRRGVTRVKMFSEIG